MQLLNETDKSPTTTTTIAANIEEENKQKTKNRKTVHNHVNKILFLLSVNVNGFIYMNVCRK